MEKIYRWFDKNIFYNIGRQVQECAIFTLIIDIILSIIGAIFVSIEFSDPFLVILVPLVGLSYILGFVCPIYAFGQLIEDIRRIRENTSGTETDIDELPKL